MFFEELLVLLHHRGQLFPSPLEGRQVNGEEEKAPLRQLLGIEHLGGESGVDVREVILPNTTGEGRIAGIG